METNVQAKTGFNRVQTEGKLEKGFAFSWIVSRKLSPTLQKYQNSQIDEKTMEMLKPLDELNDQLDEAIQALDASKEKTRKREQELRQISKRNYITDPKRETGQNYAAPAFYSQVNSQRKSTKIEKLGERYSKLGLVLHNNKTDNCSNSKQNCLSQYCKNLPSVQPVTHNPLRKRSTIIGNDPEPPNGTGKSMKSKESISRGSSIWLPPIVPSRM